MTLAHTEQAQGPQAAGLVPFTTLSLVANWAAAVRIRDQRSGEREQAHCEHDERATQARDLVHGVPPLGFSGAPVTLDPTSNRSTTSG